MPSPSRPGRWPSRTWSSSPTRSRGGWSGPGAGRIRRRPRRGGPRRDPDRLDARGRRTRRAGRRPGRRARRLGGRREGGFGGGLRARAASAGPGTRAQAQHRRQVLTEHHITPRRTHVKAGHHRPRHAAGQGQRQRHDRLGRGSGHDAGPAGPGLQRQHLRGRARDRADDRQPADDRGRPAGRRQGRAAVGQEGARRPARRPTSCGRLATRRKPTSSTTSPGSRWSGR